MLSLVPYEEKHLEALARLFPASGDPASLWRDLNDSARGRGSQVVVAVDDAPRGVAGWVGLGVAAQGILYGAPVLAASEAAARLLLGHLAERARALGARQLRVSRFPGEAAKETALLDLGFAPLLDMIQVARASRGLPEVPVPAFLGRVPFEEIDWDRFARVFNTCFAGVPNAPPVDGAAKREAWEGLDREASQVWRDSPGRYAAWIGVCPDGHVDEVGVDESLRGRRIAAALYRLAGESAASRGVASLSALLASTNPATLRLHERLGFREAGRRTVFALAIA
ncbi:MAG TPA: GNAT family N-acetyltransferase [Holophaga sp.]|nr:GNAT family N-acetyltransferase [Holophaga sp.]HPS66339.1 GNAT family N-acetyltransferase [Holophaga sp.]